MITRFAYRPGHLFGGVGTLFLVGGGSALAYLTGLKLFTGESIGSRPLLLFGVMAVIIGMQLILFGLLAELDPNAPRVSRWQAIWRFKRFLMRNIWLRLRGGWYRFGYAVVNYGKPISLRAWVAERKLDLRHASREERIANVETLARDLEQKLSIHWRWDGDRIRFDVPGGAAKGVTAIKLDAKDRVIGFCAAPPAKGRARCPGI